MKCVDREQLQAFVDRELDGDRTRLIEHHLSGCSMCSQEVEELKKLRFLLQQRGGDARPIPRFDYSRVEPKRAVINRWRVAAVAAVVAIVMGIGWGVYTKESRDEVVYLDVRFEVDANKPIGELDFVIERIELD